MQYVEDVLEKALIEHYCYDQKIHPKDFYIYLNLHYLFSTMKKGKIHPLNHLNRDKTLASFLLGSIHAEVNENNIWIDQKKISATTLLGSELRNLFENLYFQSSLNNENFEQEIEEAIKKITLQARKKVRYYRKTDIFTIYYQLVCLELLQDLYETDGPWILSHHIQKKETAVSLLKKLKRKVEAFQKQKQTTISIPEKEIEQFLFQNLEKLEEGLRPIKKQVVLPNGRLDILARDKNNNDVLIEIKSKKDTDLVWQRSYYEEEWKKKNGLPRFFIVVPHLEDHLTNTLKYLGNTEVFLYQPLVQNGELIDLVIKSQFGIKKEAMCIEQNN